MPDVPDPSGILPPTERVEWEWRTTKTKNAIGMEKIRYPIEEVPTNREISLLSTRRRAEILEDILESGRIEEWRRAKERTVSAERLAREVEMLEIEDALEKRKHRTMENPGGGLR
jgi:hypothetical protein